MKHPGLKFNLNNQCHLRKRSWSKSFEDVSFNDLSIGSTETKCIKLNTKTQNIFCRLNENLTIFVYTLTGGTKNRKRKKVFSFKVYTYKSRKLSKKIVF